MIDYEIHDGLCVLRLNAPPLNILSMTLLAELRKAITRAEADRSVRGIVLFGGEEHFSAGADVNIFRDVETDDDAVRISRDFQQAFQAVEDAEKPVIAALAGQMMGGALELAMSCHGRVCDATCRFSMPEANLGITPGAGGTQRLPRLVGVGPALEMLLSARPIDASRAAELGLVDAVCEPGEWLAGAARLFNEQLAEPGSLAKRRTGRRTDKIAGTQANTAALDEAQSRVDAMRSELIAPREILRAVQIGIEQSFAAGLEAEQRAFARCMETRATRNKLYLFFAARGMGKLPNGRAITPRTIRRAAVVGTGSMGTGIAHALMIGGIPVVAIDEDGASLDRAAAKIEKSIRGRVAQGKMSGQRCRAMLDLLSTTTRWQDLEGVDVVIEAVFEDPAAKRSVIERLERTCGESAVIATNTSTLSLDVLTADMRHPQRLVGMHFFNPAHRMPLVEVVTHARVLPEVTAAALDLARRLRKSPVLVGNREGFLVNRIFIPYLKEAFRLLEEGVSPETVDRAMVEFGFPMGPLTLVDMAGLDILVATDRVLRGAFERHGPMPRLATELAALGQYGQKTGSGVYKYAPGDHTPRESETTARLTAKMSSGGDTRNDGGTGEILPERIAYRLVMRMIAEASHVLSDGIVHRGSDVDAAMVLGVGFPDFRGGPLRYARELGLDCVAAELREMAACHGPRFSPHPTLTTSMKGTEECRPTSNGRISRPPRRCAE